MFGCYLVDSFWVFALLFAGCVGFGLFDSWNLLTLDVVWLFMTCAA